jgi:hypothetical protein
MRKAFDQTAANRIGYRWEDDRNHGCRALCHLHLGITVGHNHIDRQPDELRRDLSGAIEASFGKASLDRYGAALDPAKFTKPLHKCLERYESVCCVTRTPS